MKVEQLRRRKEERSSGVVRRTHRRENGQVVPLLAIMLPFMVLFLAFTFGTEIVLSAKAQLDQATQVSSLAAVSDACMSSTVPATIFDCGTGGVGTGGISYDASARAAISDVLQGEYPGATIHACNEHQPANACSHFAAPSTLGSPATIAYQIQWCSAASGATTLCGGPSDVNWSPYSPGNTDPWGWLTSTSGACSSVNPYFRQIEVQTWAYVNIPLAAFIGQGTLEMSSVQTSNACLGQQ